MKTAPNDVIAAIGGAALAFGAPALHAIAQPTAAPVYSGAPSPQMGGAPSLSPQGYNAQGYGAQGAGGVSLAQFQARMRNRMMKADADHDGRISLAEWTAWRAAHPGHGGAGQDPSRSFSRMDANGDGYITPDEIDAAAARRFARMDANGDGVLTPQERAARHGGANNQGGGADDEGVQPLGPQ